MRTKPIIGADILRLITAGMYDNPLVLYREYIQNSADSIAAQGSPSCSVTVDVNPIDSRITIIDDGTGLAPDEAGRRLIHIGQSTKDRDVDRGFRGVGRLAALAFADCVQFTTRSCASEAVTQVSWDGRSLRNLDLAQFNAEAAIAKCTTIRALAGDDWPHRFFQVDICGVTRHAASTLLNLDAVRRYIGEVCPVPMASCFPLASEIREYLAAHAKYFVLDVRTKGDDSPIERPFGQTIPLTDRFQAPFHRLETRSIPRLDSMEPAAILWLAHTPYSGSIPRRLAIRGVRARIGNMQIGTDRIFQHLFLEPRFNGWCVGEVHIIDNRIVPNGRRDYFEPSPHLRNLENHIGSIAHNISSRCRRASSQRNKLRSIGTAISRLKHAHDLATSRYLCPDDAAALVDRERKRILEVRQSLTHLEASETNSVQDELKICEQQLDTIAIEPKPLILPGLPPSSWPTFQSVFGAIAKSSPPDLALHMIETILGQLGQDHMSDNDRR
ncbi:MAG: ATP-binding protein [Bryobacterales bacterium]|nr:ATP-binding protein [Bryobacterales bacterium]